MSESMNRKQNEDRQNSGRRLHLREVSSEFDDYDGIGADLKAGRVRLGKDTADLAEILRIRLEHLQAIEHGQFSQLPAPVYAVGFIRTYAEYVGLNGEDAIRRFKEEAEGLTQQTALSFPTPEEESRVPRGWLLALAGIAAVLVYAGWYYAENKDRLNLAEVPVVPERLADKTTPAPLQAPQKRLQAPVPATAPIADTATTSQTGQDVQATSPVASDATDTTSMVSAGSEAATVVATVAPVVSQTTTEPTDTAVVPANVTPTSGQTPAIDTGSEAVAVSPVTVSPAEPVTQPEPPTAAPMTETVTETVTRTIEPAVTVQPEPVVQPEPTVQPVAVAEPVAEPAVEPVAEVVRQVASVAETTVVTTEPAVVVPADNTAPVAETVAETPAPAEQPVPVAVVTPVTPTPVTPTPVTPEAAPVVEPRADVQEARTEIPTASAAPGRKTEKFGSPAADSRVEIYARVDVWVQVVSENGQSLLSRILRQGDSYYAPANEVSFLTTGNAGALHILVDGNVIPPVGPPGAVRRDVSLQPESLLRLGRGPSTDGDN